MDSQAAKCCNRLLCCRVLEVSNEEFSSELVSLMELSSHLKCWLGVSL